MTQSTIWGRDAGPTVVAQSIYDESATKKHRLNDMLVLGDRVFRYAKAGSVALASGKVVQCAVPVANHLNCVFTAASVGVKEVTLTLGATAVTENQYAFGYLHVNTAANITCLRIKSHPAANASATLELTLFDELPAALTATDYGTLTKNKADSVVIAPAAGLSSSVFGVPLVAIAANYYFWSQTKGPAPVLTQGAVVIGQKVGLGGTADGACGPVALYVTDIWGRVLQVNASTQYSLIDLMLE